MNEQEHYAKAEQLLATSWSAMDPLGVAAAQVHATLAHAAATERLAKAVENLPNYEGALAVHVFGARS